MFYLLAVLIYLCGEVSKKDCQCSSSIEWKGYCISVNTFPYFNSWGKNHQSAKNLAKLLYSAQEVLMRASSLVLIFNQGDGID
jgi:hypothetical protein